LRRDHARADYVLRARHRGLHVFVGVEDQPHRAVSGGMRRDPPTLRQGVCHDCDHVVGPIDVTRPRGIVGVRLFECVFLDAAVQHESQSPHAQKVIAEAGVETETADDRVLRATPTLSGTRMGGRT